MKYLFGILLMLITATAFSQEKEQPLVQFTGVIHNADSTAVTVPYVTITNLSNRNQVYLANYKGYFSFVVHEQDTLRFTSVGFAPYTAVIPANVSNKTYDLHVNIQPQAIRLPTFRVFPWATTDEFRKDFLAMKLADDDLEIARKNISRTSIIALISSLPRDGQEIQSAWGQNEHTSIMNQHSITNPLLNPIAWGTFIKSITDGDKSRQTDGN